MQLLEMDLKTGLKDSDYDLVLDSIRVLGNMHHVGFYDSEVGSNLTAVGKYAHPIATPEYSTGLLSRGMP